MLFQLIGQGGFALTCGKCHAAGTDIAVFDLYRVAGDKIVEHWMNEEEIGPVKHGETPASSKPEPKGTPA
ncbi:hypothetical protein [Actibacterium sp. 188UL27-1]|uniref:hypothetical protein n=1 Tax=Actibacterium sp. 188UL27-1 TaxID=2786961 RepID=UPI0019567855|nr:hypothetical protein [Actibacterium sp. 188UL27-1]MBM7069232.1 hypothetical protein [Actibacterium sp. 188UL27-1]